jgi:hypothetical protein
MTWNADILVRAGKETDREVNVNKINHWAWHQTKFVNEVSIVTALCNNSPHHLTMFKNIYLTVTQRNKNGNEVHNGVKRRINFRNSWCYVVQQELSFRLLFKTLKCSMCRIIIFRLFLCMWNMSVTTQEVYKLHVIENRVLSRNLGSEKGELNRHCGI